jgi:hypothetical protein
LNTNIEIFSSFFLIGLDFQFLIPNNAGMNSTGSAKTPNFKTSDCQQLGPQSSRIISLHGAGPFMVRVHECLDLGFQGEKSRYFISVDLKFRPIDALRDFGWHGSTKSEATKEANKLSFEIALAFDLLSLAKECSLAGKDQLIKIREANLSKLLSRYSAEVS